MIPIFLMLVATATSAFLSESLQSCDKNLVPEMTFIFNGANLAWPSADTKNQFTESGRYINKNIIGTRVQIYKDEALVLMPRYKEGVPITLGKITMTQENYEPTLHPFPCWSLQEESECQAMQSAVDAAIDSQGILWVLDVGIVNTLDQPVRHCPPKVLAISIETGKVIRVIDLEDLVSPSSRLQYLVVEQDFLYISDAANLAILVYDLTGGQGFRVELPKAVTQGCSRRDVLYLALVQKSSGTNFLYFTYLTADRIFSVKTTNLQSGNIKGKVIDVGPKQGKMVLLGTDNRSAIFFRMKGESHIYMWDTELHFKPENFQMVQEESECRVATQVVPDSNQLMWVLESNFQDYIKNTTGCAGASVALHPLIKNCD